MADQDVTIAELKAQVSQFVSDREWQKFHSPKNLSMSLAIEAAELMEHFQWIETAESRVPEDEKLVEIQEELSDVLCYALAIANELDIDVSEAMRDKMVKNERKYPAAEYRGRYGPEDGGDD